MYTPNVERNRVIYDLWEKNLTVKQISTSTGIPRSTVGYYVRKFNKLAAEGKPVVFPGARKAPRESSTSVSSMLNVMKLTDIVKKLIGQGEVEKLYYVLMDMKLMSEFGFSLKPDDYRKMIDSLG